jgi:riboflavin synthase
MFTGIIQGIGKIVKVVKKGNSLRLTVNPPRYTDKSVKLGDSIAINGVCLTITSPPEPARQARSGGRPDVTSGRAGVSGRGKEYFTFDVMPETFKRTTLGEVTVGNNVNIESAIKVGEPLGGHFVQGHIDTVGIIASIKKQGGEYLMQIRCPAKIIESIIEKGSVAVDGVSLTVVNTQSNHFSVALIPFTLTHTILGEKKIGDKVNIELDIIGKWVKKLLSPFRCSTYSDEGF